MSISVEEVNKVARLARLAVTPEQAQRYAGSLSTILVLADQLEAIDTTGIVPMANPLDAVQRLRDDVVTEVNRRSDYQRIAPETLEGLYLVPKVIE